MGIRQEILNAITVTDKDTLSKIDGELDLLELTDGVENKNNLELMYDIWQRRKDGPPGTQNKSQSWTAYYLGITSVKPDGDFLPERRIFARVGFPDVDVDFDDERRDEVYNYIIERWGRENVGNIGTYNTQKMKSAIKNTVKALDSAYAFHKGIETCRSENNNLANEMTQTLGSGIVKIRVDDGNDIVVKKLKDAYEHVPDFKGYMDRYPEVYRHTQEFEGLVSSFGVHAAGIVISNIPLSRIAPLRESKKGLATQFVSEDLEQIGLIKYDILAIAALTVIKNSLILIKDNYGIDIDIEKLPLDDARTFQLYRTGKLGGVFQCENGGMQETMREIKVDNFSDVMAAIALYRPGPMDSIPEYVARKNGHKETEYFHKSIEPYAKPYLEKTYGVLVYQEQVMQICQALANFSITQGYIMIKAVGKKKHNILDKCKQQFIEGCVENKVPQNIADQYWERFITPFADYGFNASHSCCYAYLSYQTAYLKANYPDEFAVAFMNSFSKRAMFKSADSWDNVAMMMRDASRNMNIKILPKTLNDCGTEFVIARKKDSSSGIMQTEIRPSISCKGLGFESSKNIAANRPYTDLQDFAEKTDPKIVTTESLTALIEAGVFKGDKGRREMQTILDKFIIIRTDLKMSRKKGIKSHDIFS